MLEIIIPRETLFDEETETFSEVGTKLRLEHSLLSLSKWESRFQIPFLSNTEKTREQILQYICDMSVDEDVDLSILDGLTEENIHTINDYINNKMTATWFAEEKKAPNRQIITAELIYYWIFTYGIAIECQHWHLNRLLTLVRVFNRMNAPKTKQTHGELMAQRRALNARRRAELGTSG
jgi:hypothetical protein